MFTGAKKSRTDDVDNKMHLDEHQLPVSRVVLQCN